MSYPLPVTGPGARPSLDTIIAGYYRAVGGYTRLVGVETRRMQGTYTEGDLQATTEIGGQRPMGAQSQRPRPWVRVCGRLRWLDLGMERRHGFVEREVATGRLLNTLQWDLIENDAAVTASELMPPVAE